MGKPSLTTKQYEIFMYTKEYIEKNGYAPTLQKIATQFGLKSLATVSEHLDEIKMKGYITREYRKKQSIRII